MLTELKQEVAQIAAHVKPQHGTTVFSQCHLQPTFDHTQNRRCAESQVKLEAPTARAVHGATELGELFHDAAWWCRFDLANLQKHGTHACGQSDANLCDDSVQTRHMVRREAERITESL